MLKPQTKKEDISWLIFFLWSDPPPIYYERYEEHSNASIKCPSLVSSRPAPHTHRSIVLVLGPVEGKARRPGPELVLSNLLWYICCSSHTSLPFIVCRDLVTLVLS